MYVDSDELILSCNLNYGTLSKLILQSRHNLSEFHVQHLSAQIACGIFELNEIGLVANYITSKNCIFDKRGFVKLINVETVAIKGNCYFLQLYVSDVPTILGRKK